MPVEKTLGKTEGVSNAMKLEGGKLYAVIRRVDAIGLPGWHLRVMRRVSAR